MSAAPRPGPGVSPRPVSGVSYRGRFAPSPTGPLHFGSLVAAVGSYCDARVAGGQWLVRIEDIDAPRARPGAEAHILRTLVRYGFGWDGPVVRQSARLVHYREALEQLISQGDVFPCRCTRRALRDAPAGISGEPLYPGTCRLAASLTTHPAPDAPFAWRQNVQQTDAIAFVDRLLGPQGQDLRAEVGDFVVRRADGLFAYQLAVVVDDAAQGITDVVRGTDLLTCTARQIHLQRRLGLPTPRYLHLPIAVNGSGEKLSKQTRAQALADDPVPTLLAAWRFLDQPLPPELPGDPAAFWQWALARWDARRVPPVPMLPAPPDAAESPPAGSV
ncbi:MAG: tRNA glutamyl-Q(34) synthetase GluQRS [Casimicrobiaceae bacterium]